jgi:hypothetical protein
MIKAVILGLAVLGGAASAFADDSTKTVCFELAKSALMDKLHISDQYVSSLGGAVVGDGAAVVDINIFTVVAGANKNGRYVPSAVDGGYEVEFENDSADSCEASKADAQIRRLKE